MSCRVIRALCLALPFLGLACAPRSSTSTRVAQAGACAVPPRPVVLTGAGLTTREGRIEGFTTTPNGDMDGVLLSGNARVHFPAYTGRAVFPLVQPGNTIRVSGWEVSGPEGRVLEATKIMSRPSGRTVDVAAQPVPRSAAAIR